MSYLFRVAGRAAVLLCLALVSPACTPAGDDQSTPDTRAAQTGFRGVAVGTPIARPDFTLTDTHGRPFDFRRETEGKVALLFFGYTNCPDVCPLHMANIAAVLAKMSFDDRDAIRTIFVTTDPARDTPKVLRAWLDQFDPTFVGLTGTTEEVDRIQLALGLRPAQREPAAGGADSDDYLVGHAAQVIAFGKDGPARLVYPFGTRQTDWANDLPLLARGTMPRASPAATTSADDGALQPDPDVTAGDLVISRVVVPVPSTAERTSLYLRVQNHGDAADTLVAIQTDAAGAAMLHDQRMVGSSMVMEPLDAPFVIPALGEAWLAPGGAHGMLEPLLRPLGAGDHVAVSLTFARGGVVGTRAIVVPYAQLESVLGAPAVRAAAAGGIDSNGAR
jgi:protein SCO1/2